jgi:hypothetical protein
MCRDTIAIDNQNLELRLGTHPLDANRKINPTIAVEVSSHVIRVVAGIGDPSTPGHGAYVLQFVVALAFGVVDHAKFLMQCQPILDCCASNSINERRQVWASGERRRLSYQCD